MSTTRARRAFVGRALELEMLGAALERASAGEPNTMVVAGEAGIGKTRLVEEAGIRAAAAGALVLAGASVEHAPDVPFLALAEALRDLLDRLGGPAVHELAGHNRPELAALLPELAQPGDPVPTGAAAQGRLFAVVRSLLDRVGDAQPVVLCIDDLQWADASTRSLLVYLAHTFRAERILLITTVRTDELHRDPSLRPLLVDLGRRAHRLDLLPFGRPEVEAQIAAITGRAVSTAFADAIHARSGGNALFVEELASAGSVAIEGVPRSALRDLLHARLEALSAQARQAVDLVAVTGREVRHELLVELDRMSPPALVSGLAAAVDSSVLAATDSGYRFRHPLIQEVAYAQLLPAERRPLHRAIAQALERMPELSADAGAAAAAELARHWAAAGDEPRALGAHVVAGGAAVGGNAFAEAAAQFESALRLWPRVAPAERPAIGRADLLARTARAAELSGGHGRAEALWREAAEGVDATADPERAAAFYRGLGTSLWSSGRADEAVAAMEAAAKLAAAGPPSAEKAETLADLARMLAFPARADEGRAHARTALATAREVRSASAQSRAHHALGALERIEGRTDAAIAELERSLELARAGNEPEATGAPCINLSYTLREAGRFHDAIRVAHEGVALSREVGLERFDGAFLLGTVAESMIALGRLDEAEHVLAEASALGPTGLAAQSLSLLAADLAIVRGRFDEATRHVDAADGPGQDASLYQPYIELARAEIAVWQGRRDAARAAVARGLETAGPGFQPRIMLALCATGARAEADEALAARSTPADSRVDGEAAVVARLAPIVAEQRDGPGSTAEWQALAHVFEGERARLGGTADAEPFAEAARLFDLLGCRHPAAYSRFREAEARLTRRGSRTRATQALRSSLAAAAALQAKPLEAEIAALARRARIDLSAVPAARPRARLPFGLTARELEVLGLLVEGRTDRQIASTLFISSKTAGVHVTHILGKLDVHSRIEAAAAAHRLRLLEPREDPERGARA